MALTQHQMKNIADRAGLDSARNYVGRIAFPDYIGTYRVDLSATSEEQARRIIAQAHPDATITELEVR